MFGERRGWEGEGLIDSNGDLVWGARCREVGSVVRTLGKSSGEVSFLLNTTEARIC